MSAVLTAATSGEATAAEYAIARGEDALRQADHVTAARWLDRAARITSFHPTPVLLLASALCRQSPQEARSLLETLVARYPTSLDGWVALLTIHTLLQDMEAASEGLARFLQWFRPPPSRSFQLLADRIAGAVGAPGWLGFDAEGTIVISHRTRTSEADISFCLDDKPMRSPSFASRLHARIAKCPASWHTKNVMSATHRSRPLLGSGLSLTARRESTGYVGYRPELGLVGHAWRPADPDVRPVLRLQVIRNDGRSDWTVPIQTDIHPTILTDGQRGFEFRVPGKLLGDGGAVRVLSEDGRDLWGSPLHPFTELNTARRAAASLARALAAGDAPSAPTLDLWRPLHVIPRTRDALPAPRRGRPKRPGHCDIVVPVHNGQDDLVRCLESVWPSLPKWARVVVVDDGSTEPGVRAWLDREADLRRIVLVRHPHRLGFPASVQSGLGVSAGEGRRCDVVLLNSDTIVPAGWLERLAAAAYSAGDIGSVTPLSHDGSLVSSPEPRALGALDGPDDVAVMDRICAQAHGAAVVDIPTAVGFCMFIRSDCLDETGGFRTDVFAQGYGEENDWCMRARALGWRHVAAAGTFVAHFGGRSFGAAKTFLIQRNLEILNRLHPGYAAFVEDPAPLRALADVWRAIHERQWEARFTGRRCVILVTHAEGGGVQKFVDDRCAAFEAAGMLALVLCPQTTTESGPDDHALRCVLRDGLGRAASLDYEIPRELDRLAGLLRSFDVQTVELHHLLGLPPDIVGLAEKLGVPVSVHVHDYGFWCPRFNLVGAGGRYCGEPDDVTECDCCIADLGTPLRAIGSVAEHRARSQEMLAQARTVIVPSLDVQARFRRHFPAIETSVQRWAPEPPAGATQPPISAGRFVPRRIVIVGAIGPEKGYDVLLACARDAARRSLNLEFSVVGFTTDDRRLLDTGKVFISGRYSEPEAQRLVRGCEGDLGFVPSVWPETWCFALSHLFEAGLDVVSFDIGTQAERIQALRRGLVLPLSTPAARINNFLLARLGEPAV